MERVLREEQIKETIQKVWFDEEFIFVETDTGGVFKRSISSFPRLKNATPQQRESYEIGKFGDGIHWEGIDEDIHLYSFLNAFV